MFVQPRPVSLSQQRKKSPHSIMLPTESLPVALDRSAGKHGFIPVAESSSQENSKLWFRQSILFPQSDFCVLLGPYFSETMTDILLELSFIKSPACKKSLFQNDEACAHEADQANFFVFFSYMLCQSVIIITKSVQINPNQLASKSVKKSVNKKKVE